MISKLSPQPLVSNLLVNTQQEKLAFKVSEITRDRHAKWLISQKYLIKKTEVDDVLGNLGIGGESIIFGEGERSSDNQRVLLEVEKAKIKERQLQAKQEKILLQKVTNRVASVTEKLLTERMLRLPIDKLLWGFPNYGFFTSFAYSPSLSFSKLGTMTTLSKPLSSNILELVKNPYFCKLLGKTLKPVTDPKSAIGFVGVDNCRRLFPLLMTKPLLRTQDKNTRTITPKIWQHSVLTANVTRTRLEGANYQEPDEGILIGVIRALPYYAISNYFTQTFEDALVEVMVDYRKKKLMNEYYACAEIKPTLYVLPKLIMNVEKPLAKRIVDHIEWDSKSKHLRLALMEDIQDTPITERSLHGAALGQARTFSIYEMMDRSNIFVDKHIPYWFSHVRMDKNEINSVRKANPGKMFIVS